MMKDELEKLIGKPVSMGEWDIIHQVYQYYPGIKDVGGKGQVAKLWEQFGIRIFQDMLPRAEKLAELDYEKQRLHVKLADVEDAILMETKPIRLPDPA